MKKIKYEVWMGFKNYTGEINDKECIAVFYSEYRASEYLNLCWQWSADNSNDTYWIESK